jgi:DNA-binding CsgD family transcriptional regulator
MPVRRSWPLVGREDELELVAGALRDGAPGVVVSGPAGVGKTRLAQEVLTAAAAEGAEIEWVQATQAAASVPLGAFAALVPPGVRTDDRLQLFGLCADTLRERGGSRRVVLAVDDAQLLDASSAALVLHLVSSETVFSVATVRAGEPCQDSIVALWKDLECPRIELQQLSEDETGSLLESVLGGEVAPTARRWAFAASEGHVLYLRELVKGSLAAGALVEEEGRWELRTQPAVSPALAELISAELDGLSPGALDVVRMLAIGEPLEVDTIAAIVSPAALSSLEEAGLVSVARGEDAARNEVRLGHPLYGEVVHASLPTMRGNELRELLADSVRAAGLERPGDAMRVAVWLEEAGAALDEPLVLAAARDANAASDPELAERFARRVPPGPEQALVLGTSYVLRHRFAEAEAVLAEAEGTLPSPEQADAYLEWRVRALLGISANSEALDLLDRAERWFDDAAWPDRVDVARAEIALDDVERHADQALVATERLLRKEDILPGVRRRASIARTLALFYAGRGAEARALAEQVRPSVLPRGHVDEDALTSWANVLAGCGYDWDELEEWLAEAARATARGGDTHVRGVIQTHLAALAVRRGMPATACERAREAIEHLERIDPDAWLPAAWLFLVMGAAMRRDTDAARAALRASEVARGDRGGYRWQEAMARGLLLAAEGQVDQPAALLLAAAKDEDRPHSRASLLHQAFRVGAPPETVAPLLEMVAASCDAPIASAQAGLVTAAAARDAHALTESARALEAIGAWMSAAEAAGLASAAFADAGREDSARRARALSFHLLESCEDAWSPILSQLELVPAELTQREREIVSLAASGASNAEIAEQLVVSIRTVESHLYRAMRKLGVSTRAELRGVVAPRS